MYPWKKIIMLTLGYGKLLPWGSLPHFCDRVIIIIYLIGNMEGITLQEKKIKSCYRGDLKEAKVVRNYGGTFREQQAVGWGRVQGKGSGGGEKTEGSRALLWTLNPTSRAKRRHCDLWGGTAWSKLSFSELALRQEEGLRAQFRSHAQSHTRVYGQEGKAGTRGLPWGRRNHTSQLSLLGKKPSFKDLVKCPYYSLTTWFAPIEKLHSKVLGLVSAQMQTEYAKIALWNSKTWGKTVKKSQLFQLIETPATRWGNELEEKYKQPQSEAAE